MRHFGMIGGGLALVLWAMGVHGADVASSAGLPADPLVPAQLLRTLLGLLVVVGLIVAAGWLLRRLGQSRWQGSGALRVVGGLAVGPRERVVLMQVGARQVLLGVTPGSVRLLLALDEALPDGVRPDTPPGEPTGDEGGFRGHLAAALRVSRAHSAAPEDEQVTGRERR